jgi:cytochrome c5
MLKLKASCCVALLITAIAFELGSGGRRVFAGTHDDQAGSQATSPAAPQKTTQHSGEEIFAANCSRCHKPPMTIPPQATGTVIMHMRVRARLSRHDEQVLLRYLAP